MNLLVSFLALFIAFSGCGDVNRRFGSKTDAPTDILNPGESPLPPIFPHPDDWKNTHGSWVLTGGDKPCLSCHTTGGENDPDKPPTCNSCHADYPHPDAAEWVAFTGGHGEKVKVTYGGSTETCKLCHGEDLKKSIKGLNCNSCHGSYPHSANSNWGQYEGHGLYTLSHSMEECQTCHGTDYQGGERGNPSCFSCHKPFPHNDGWYETPMNGKKQGHGLYVENNGTTTCATANCHGVNLVPTPGTSQGPNCTTCHQPYPHPENWSSGYLHGPVALADIGQCKACHGANLDYAPAGSQSCADCHESFLHHSKAKGTFTGWETGAHGQYVLQNGRDTTQCQLCHGDNYDGGISHKSCRTCHASFPHDLSSWVPNRDHATFVNAPEGGGTTQCQLCHGADLNGGRVGVSCRQCHQSFPHDTSGNWNTEAGHGEYVRSDPDHIDNNLTECLACHGTQPGSFGETACTTCHEFPHTDPNWAAPGTASVHAPTFIGKVQTGQTNDCTRCHGTNYDRLVAGNISCRTCHTNGVSHIPINGATWNTGDGHGHYFSASFRANNTDARCWACHGAPISLRPAHVATPPINTPEKIAQEKAFLADQSDCYQCHFAYPHKDYDQGFGDNHWEPVVTSTCDNRAIANFAHVLYLFDSPLFTDATGQHPVLGTTPEGDPLWNAAIQNTCGGNTPNSCHFNGNRTYRTGNASSLCGSACHGTNRDFPPDLPDCAPPPATEQLAGPPIITATTPANGATHVPVIGQDSYYRTPITVTFNEPMDRVAITSGRAIELKKTTGGPHHVDARVTCDTNYCRVATITPVSQLLFSTGYQLVVSTLVKDYGGTPLALESTIGFTTADQDITPPSVISTNPASDARDVVSGTTVFTAHFNEVLRSNTVQSGAFTIRRPNGTLLQGEVTCTSSSNCDTAQFVIRSWMPRLRDSTRYNACISPDATHRVSDLSGNPMTVPYCWYFTTTDPFFP